jgi:uncharacterized membrane protein YfcA
VVSFTFLAVLSILGFVGALIAGFLGVGGAIIMIPLLLYVPPWLGFPDLTVKTIAAISMVQVFFAALSGAVAHGRHGTVHRALTLIVGGAAAIGSLVGGRGGAFLLVPLLITVIGVPTRVTIGSSLAITLWTATAGLVGKLVTGQIAFACCSTRGRGHTRGAQEALGRLWHSGF